MSDASFKPLFKMTASKDIIQMDQDLLVAQNARKNLWLLTSAIISTFSSLFPQVAQLMLKAN